MTDLSPETVERMVALVRAAAVNGVSQSAIAVEARAIIPLLPEPVDPDLVEAKAIIRASYGSPYFHGGTQLQYGDGPRRVHDIITGAGDDYWEVKAVRAAIKRGRTLATSTTASDGRGA